MSTWQTFAHEADVGVRGGGASVAEAFAGVATALTSIVCDPAAVAARQTVAVECSAPDIELLLVDWLNALIYEMATRHMLFSRFEVVIAPSADGGFTLGARVAGEAVDVARHQPAAEAKGASYCELSVAQGEDGTWRAQCVVDV